MTKYLCRQNISQNGKYLDLTFATWMAYNVPTTILNVLVAWTYLIVLNYGLPDKLAFWRSRKNPEALKAVKIQEENVAKILKMEYKKLGNISFQEGSVALLFFTVIMLWVFRDPRIIKGWGPLFTAEEVDDSTPAMLIVLLLFIIPRDHSFLFGSKYCCS